MWLFDAAHDIFWWRLLQLPTRVLEESPPVKMFTITDWVGLYLPDCVLQDCSPGKTFGVYVAHLACVFCKSWLLSQTGVPCSLVLCLARYPGFVNVF